MEYAPVTSSTAPGFMKKSLEIPRAKNTSEVSCAIQVLDELMRKYDWKLQRLYDMLPEPIEQQLVLEDRDGSATYESVKRRANNWIMMNSTGRADMDFGTVGQGRDDEDDDGGQDRDSSGDLVGLKGGKGKEGKGQYSEWTRQHWQRLVEEPEREGKGKVSPKRERMGRMGPD